MDIENPKHFALLFGMFVLIGAIYFAAMKRKFIKSAYVANGVIIDKFIPRSSENYGLTAKIEFFTTDGKRITFTEQISFRGEKYAVNSNVSVLYDPNYPLYAHINSFWYLWIGEFFALIGGGFTIFVGIYAE